MKLARLLFKPKWQEKDPQVRRAAVSGEHDAELVDALPRIAREDPDAGVRIAALKRLHDYEAWRERSTGDAEGAVRLAARDVYVGMLCSNDARVPPLARRIAELDTLSPAEIERVASQALDRELRAAALARVTRQALLLERALKDSDAGLRASIVERIDSATTLERIAESARKTDKNISRLARERAAALRIGSGNAQAIAHKAQTLSTRMETLMRSAGGTDAAADEIEREWSALADHVEKDTQARYRGALAVVRQMQAQARNPKPVELPMPQIVETAWAHLDSGMLPAGASPATVDLITSQARFDAALATAANEAQQERDARRVRIQEIEKLALHFASDLEAGDISKAQSHRNAIAPIFAAVDTLPVALGERLAALNARHDQLRHWQQWASQQRRQAICEKIEALVASNPHPDALATGVREAREEWRKLDAADGGDAAESGMSRRFNALCHRALKPAKTYFDKRDQLRRTRTEEVEKLLLTAADLPAAIADWKAAATLRRGLASALHDLDSVDPRERTALAKRLKTAIASLAERIEAQESEVETAKQRLIARACALPTTDGRGAARQVQDLQREWTALGQGRRGTDQKQWQAFRKACDAVFSGLDAAKKERVAETNAATESARQILGELEALTAASPRSKAEAKSTLREIESRWHALEARPRELDARYRKLIEGIETAQRSAARNERLSRFNEAIAKYQLLQAVQKSERTRTELEASWASIGSARTAAEEMALALDGRRASLESGADAFVADDETARNRLVELEFIAGVETAEDDRQRRMNYQLQRLAAKMRNKTSLSAEVELSRALSAWFAQAPQRDTLEERFLRAARAGIASLP